MDGVLELLYERRFTSDDNPEKIGVVSGESKVYRGLTSLNVVSDLLVGIESATIVIFAVLVKVIYLNLYLRSYQPMIPFIALGVAASFVTIFIFRSRNLYKLDEFIKTTNWFRTFFLAIAGTFLIVVALLFMLKIGAYFSRGWLLLWFLSCVGTISLERYLVRSFLRSKAAKGQFRTRVVVYGGGNLGQRVCQKLIENQQDFCFFGLFDDEPLQNATHSKLSGGIDALVALSQQHDGFDRVIIALPASEEQRICDVMARLSVLPVDIQLCPEIISLPIKVRGASFVGELNLLELQRRPLTERGTVLKCSLDYALASLTLIALAPLFLFIAIAIKLNSRGPVFFRQRRHGFNHQVIRVFKFRTMMVTEDGDAIKQAEAGDQRVTTVGRILRKTSLDELPQLINVLRGEMSLVGPRPHALAHNEYYRDLVASYATRHRVKPGITGWAQVHGYRGETRNPDQMRKRVEYDLAYIENWSLLLDLKILLLTAGAVMRCENAH